MSVKTRLVASIAVVLVLTLGALAVVVSTLASNQSGETEREAAQARSAAEGLAEVTAELSRLVGQFKI